MGKLSRDKGIRFERDLVHQFSEVMPGARVARGFQWRDGQDAPDVDIPAFWVEAKVGKQPNARAALRQALAASRGSRWPLAVCKEDYELATATMYLKDFLLLLEQWYPGRVQ